MSSVSDIVKRYLSLGDEQEWFEYKRGTAVSDPDEIGEYISALSNATLLAGEPYGYLIWGIHNKTHELTGTAFNYQKDIHNEPFQHYLSRYVSPTIYFQFDEDVLDEKRIVVLSIPAARVVPTEYREVRYIRIGSSKEKLKKYPDRELIRRNPKITRKQMAQELGVSDRTVQRLLNEMPEVQFTGGGRSGHWVINE